MEKKSRGTPDSTPGSSRRSFIAASGAAALMGHAARSLGGSEVKTSSSNVDQAIYFPGSFLHCSPSDSGIWVRVQMECYGRLTDVATGQTDEYVLGVMAKTGLTTDAQTGQVGPGYDYWIIFSKTHVFTKRSHTSAYFNNPTVLEHKNFGEANWRVRQVPAEPLQSVPDVRRALENWQELTARTTFTSDDGETRFSVEYPVKWADFMLNSTGFRVETGPVFLLNPNKLRVGQVPDVADFQWAYFDYRTFDKVHCLQERPTSIFEGATFTPPTEHSRQFRKNPALTEPQMDQLRDVLFSEKRITLPAESVTNLLSTDHYSQKEEVGATTEMYALAD